MRKLLEELKKFIATATPEELDQAWKEVEQFKDVGPSVKDFCEQYKKVAKSEWFKKTYQDKSIGETLEIDE